MSIKILRFVGLLRSALVLGLTLTHVLQAKGSAGLSGVEWLKVQNTFCGGFATVGGIAEILGLLTTGTLGIAFLAKRHCTAALVPLLAATCFAGTLLAFAFGNVPVNAKTAVWTAATLPQNWPAYRASREAAHAISAGLSAVAFLALATTLVWGRAFSTEFVGKIESPHFVRFGTPSQTDGWTDVGDGWFTSPMAVAPVFNGDALVAELDARRVELSLGWPELAQELTEQSSKLRAALNDHAVCPGALVRTVKRGSMSCQYALMLLQWLGRAPEEFLIGRRREVGDTRLPTIGTDVRLRWDLPQLYTTVNAQRRQRELTWAALAAQVGCTSSRLTNLRTARLADMDLTLRLTQWLGRPAADFVHPATW